MGLKKVQFKKTEPKEAPKEAPKEIQKTEYYTEYYYVLFDVRQKALCGVYDDLNVVHKIIDKLHREDINNEIEMLKSRILNNNHIEYSSQVLNSLENQLKIFDMVRDGVIKNGTSSTLGYIHSYQIADVNKSNYLYYTVRPNDFNKTILCFTQLKLKKPNLDL